MGRLTIVEVTLWEVVSTPVAVCGAVSPEAGAREVWIPLSLVTRLARRGRPGAPRPELAVHLPEWKARELGLEY